MNVRALVMALVMLLASTVAPAAAGPLGVQGDSEVFAESVLEDKGWLGSWSPGEDVVTYGAAGHPGWVVEYSEGHAGDLEAWADASHERTVRSHNNDSNMMVVSAPADAIGISWSLSLTDALRHQSYVERIGVNRRLSIDPIASGALRNASAWEAPAGSWLATYGGYNGDLSADGAAWSDEVNTSSMGDVRQAVGADELAVDGSGVRVAVLDTGLDYDNETFGDRVPMGKNVITNETINASAGDYEAVADGAASNHGSWVATMIAGNGPANATGIAPGAEVVPVKVLADDGSGSTADIAAGLEYACGEADADIVSMSLGSAVPSMQIETEIAECLDEDDVSAVVVAAGNSRMTYRYVASPGDSERVISVAASDTRALNESESAYFSNVGPDPETGVSPTIAAPGMSITANLADGNKTLSGTSMATPVVSGALALTLDAHPDLAGNPAELRSHLERTAEPMPNAGVTEVGAGRVSAVNAVEDVEPETDQEGALDDAAAARDTGNEALAGSLWRSLLGETEA